MWQKKNKKQTNLSRHACRAVQGTVQARRTWTHGKLQKSRANEKLAKPKRKNNYARLETSMITCISLTPELLIRSNSLPDMSVSVQCPLASPAPPFSICPFSVGPGPHLGCHMAPPCKYISSPSPKGSPHFVQRAHVGWKWWLSPACVYKTANYLKLD